MAIPNDNPENLEQEQDTDSTHSPNPKPATIRGMVPLTKAELEDLRKDMWEAAALFDKLTKLMEEELVAKNNSSQIPGSRASRDRPL